MNTEISCKKIMNIYVNFVSLTMIELMNATVDITEKIGESMSTAFTGNEQHIDDKKKKEIEDDLFRKQSEMIQDIKNQMKAKSDLVLKIMEKISDDPEVFDGIKIVDNYTFSLPKFYEDLSEDDLRKYSLLLHNKDANLTSLMKELSSWMEKISEKYPDLGQAQ